MNHQVIRASTDDTDILSQVIAAAFCDLAPSIWLAPSREDRQAILPGYFRLLVEHVTAAGVVHTVPDRTAAALWLSAGPQSPALPADYDERLAAVTGPLVDRFRAFETALHARQPAEQPHWYLAVLAVHPDSQGRGTGTALLHAGHEMTDRDSLPVYLEASDLRTRRLYLHHHYTDHGAPLQLPGGPCMHPMQRDPGRPVP